MGCGQSHVDAYSSKGRSYPNVMAQNGGLRLNSMERKILSNAISSTGENMITISEEAIVKPPPKELGSFSLPECPFLDGRLGVTDDEEIDEIVSNLPEEENFVDLDFPPNTQSLFFTEESVTGNDIEWKRPHELSSNPKVFVGGVNRRDVIQGKLGDCWFLSSCAAVAKDPKLIQRVIPSDQPLIGDGYKGIIVCRLWRFGDWVTVCIDDLLPTSNGELVYARSEDPNEFWIALLEKAYAKLHGSYQALEGGQSMDAMVDLTGGIAERYDLEESPDKKKLFRRISKATRSGGAFITTSRKGDWKQAFKTDKNGLVEGHAYTVSGVAKVDHRKRGVVPLIRMRNPWGNSAEWIGRWSDGDEMWDHVSQDMRRKLLRDDKKDGEFWMSFDDFYKEFEEISLCNMGPDFNNDGVVDVTGTVLAIKGSWEIGKNAGGSRNDFPKFATNPQLLLTIKEAEEDDEASMLDANDIDEGTGKCQVLIGVMQEHRLSVKGEGIQMHQIGFTVYKVTDPSQRITLAQFRHTYDEGTSGVYINYREVIARLELVPGYYAVIPATFNPDTPASFMVRVYSPSAFELSVLE